MLSLVLDRVPLGADEEVAAHLREMLAAQRLGEVELFVLPEVELGGSGLIPELLVAPLRDWLDRLAGDAAARSEVIRTTLDGAIRSLVSDVDTLAASGRGTGPGLGRAGRDGHEGVRRGRR